MPDACNLNEDERRELAEALARATETKEREGMSRAMRQNLLVLVLAGAFLSLGIRQVRETVDSLRAILWRWLSLGG